MDYEILPYRDEFLEPVVRMQKYLWTGSFEENLSFFKWKYEENPNSERPLGFVALYRSVPVGFKSLYPTRWEIDNGKNSVLMLSPTDTVIHPDHRRKGLFTAMTELSIKQYEGSQYQVFINLSANEQAAAGNKKMGWLPISHRRYLRKYNVAGLLNYFLIKIAKNNREIFNIPFGRYGTIEVSDTAKPEEMHGVLQKQSIPPGKISMYKDVAYLKYRYQNPRKRFVFYYCWKHEKIVGYMVIKKLPKNNNVHIVDYAESETTAIEKILEHIIVHKHYGIISIWNSSLDHIILQTLQREHFHTKAFFDKIETVLRGSYYLLTRPIQEKLSEGDWFVDDIDIRDTKNWIINEFCCDPD
jgi:hypothetical protein